MKIRDLIRQKLKEELLPEKELSDIDSVDGGPVVARFPELDILVSKTGEQHWTFARKISKDFSGLEGIATLYVNWAGTRPVDRALGVNLTIVLEDENVTLDGSQFFEKDGKLDYNSPDLEKAARYIWLKRQTPLKEDEYSNESEKNDRWYYRDLDHMEVTYKNMPSYEQWEFRTNVSGGGQIARIEHWYGSTEYNLKFIGTEDSPENAERFVIKSGVLDMDSLVKYIWLKIQKPLRENFSFQRKKMRGEHPIEGLKGWKYTYQFPKMGEGGGVYIYDGKNVLVGFMTDGNLDYSSTSDIRTHGRQYGKLQATEKESEQRYFPNVETAARFIWLKRQKPQTWIQRQIGRIVSESEMDVRLKFPETDNWEAFLRNDGLWLISDKEHNPKATYNVHTGKVAMKLNTAFPYPGGKFESNPAGDVTNIDQAVRYAWLKSQKPISWLKRQVSKIVSEDILNEKKISEKDIPKAENADTIMIPNIDGWWAMRLMTNFDSKSNKWDIHRVDWNWTDKSHGTRVAIMYDGGTLLYYVYDKNNNPKPVYEERPDLANNPIQAARYVFLKTQDEVITEDTTTQIDKDSFTLGKKVGDIINFKKLNYYAMLRDELIGSSGRVYYWVILDDLANFRNKEVAILHQDGTLSIRKFGGWDIHQKFQGGIKMAAKYVWLKKQQPLTESIVSEIVKDSAKLKEVTVDGLAGWRGVIVRPESRHNYGAITYIYDNNNELRGSIDKNGGVLFQKSLYDTLESDKTSGYDAEDEASIRKAIRFIWLKGQEPLTEGAIHGVDVENRITADGLDGWEARYILNRGKGNLAYYIFDNSGKEVGAIGEYGLLFYEQGENILQSDHSFYVNVKDADSIRQAMRYVFLRTQKPAELATEEISVGRKMVNDDPNHFRPVATNDVEAWVANVVEPGYEKYHTNPVYIYDENGNYVGSITEDGGYRLVGSFDEMERGRFNPSDDNSIRQAIRYLYLKSQKPLNEWLSTPKFREGNKQEGYEKQYSGLGYRAILRRKSALVMMDDGSVRTLYDPTWSWQIVSKLLTIGYLYNTGTIQYASKGILNSGKRDNIHTEKFDKGIDAAVRYIWLRRQRPISETELTEKKDSKYSENYYFDEGNNHGDVYEFDKLRLKAKYINKNSQPYWSITEYEPDSGRDFEIGMLWWDGDLEVMNQDTISWDTEKGFGTNLENAVRYIWLKKQRPK